MAEPRRTRKKKSPGAKKSGKKPAMSVQLKRGVSGLIVLVVLVIVLGLVVHQALKKSRPATKGPGPVASIP
ncbi:MAG: hypothetical protein Q7U40_06715, partial [Desulfatirhabdiaceae bacterium]|nr:hypothetical protein [Desulfatirhabdiaceae bacterium]